VFDTAELINMIYIKNGTKIINLYEEN
jgi:hypothetical protein